MVRARHAARSSRRIPRLALVSRHDPSISQDLAAAADFGTAHLAKPFGASIAAKTGTTSEGAWLAGWTPAQADIHPLRSADPPVASVYAQVSDATSGFSSRSSDTLIMACRSGRTGLFCFGSQPGQSATEHRPFASAPPPRFSLNGGCRPTARIIAGFKTRSSG
jgi:hypothetical protein